ncbi:MAG: mechanosensitive ion channel [Acidimicrobiia bacterium]|nr:mechanosensitive ion channel [Acidimicrobiia bacterium]
MDWISDQLGINPSTQGKILASLIVFAALTLIRWSIIRAVARGFPDDEDASYRTRKITAYAATVIAIVTLAFIWVEAFNDFGTYLGLVSAGIAIALADLLKNMAGWAYIVVRRPFRVGDRIEFRDIRGDVIDVRLFRFSLMEVGNWVDADQSTGRLIHIPSGLLFTHELVNYTEGFPYMWDEIPVLVTFESDHRRAEELIYEAMRVAVPNIESAAAAEIRETARRYQIKLGALTPTVYLSVRDSGVLLTGRYLTTARGRRDIEQAVWRAILDGFSTEPTVELAYPTTRTYLRGPIELGYPNSQPPGGSEPTSA